MIATIRALLAVLKEAGIECRLEQYGGCENALVDPPCEMCQARADLAEAEGRR